MLFALIAVSLAFVVVLWMYLFGQKAAPPRPTTVPSAPDTEVRARQKAEAELEKKRKELDEQRATLAEVKEQLKQAKRKLFEQKSVEKDDNDLAKAREQVERQASAQLEATRAELAAAHGELLKLKADLETSRRRPVSAPNPLPAVAAPPPPAAPQRVIRELSDADKEKIQRLEQQSTKDRARAGELERELKRVKGRVDTQGRMQASARAELELTKDKFKALEKRLNRTLLERDLLKRAIADLEKKSGVRAERTELSAEELADSDTRVEAKQQAEAQAQADAQAKAEEKAREAAAAQAEPPALPDAPPQLQPNPPQV